MHPKLKDEIIGQIEEHLRQGNYLQTACLACGISRSNFYYWLERGQEDQANDIQSSYRELFERLDTVFHQAEADLVADIAKGGFGWQAKAWILERTRFSKFGQRQRLEIEEVSGRVNIPPPAASYEAWLSDSRQTRLLPPPALTDDDLIAEAEGLDAEEIEIVQVEDESRPKESPGRHKADRGNGYGEGPG